MIVRIARKELLDLFRDGRFRWAALITFVLLAAALATGWNYHSAFEREKNAAAEAERERWLGQDAKNPHSAAHYGIYAFKSQSPLAAMDRGVEPFVGVSVWLEAHRQNQFVFRPAQDATAVQRFGEMTAATVLQILLPLFIVLLCFASFAGEKEQGTLRQVLSFGVRPRDLALGKIAGLSAALAMLLVPAVIIGVLVMNLSPSSVQMDWTRLVGMTLVYLLYLGTFVFISLGVSALASSARLSLVVLLCFWIVNGLIAPRAVSDWTARTHPTPSALEFQLAMEHALGDEHAAEELEQLRVELMREHGVDRVEDLPIDWRGVSLQRGEEHGYRVFDEHYGAIFDTFRAQDRLGQTGAVFAPLLAARPLSMVMAGTDFEHHRHFITAAEEHRRVIQKIMNDEIMANPQPDGARYISGPELWAEVPEFRYELPPPASMLGHHSPAIALLVMWFALSLVFAVRSAVRLKP